MLHVNTANEATIQQLQQSSDTSPLNPTTSPWKLCLVRPAESWTWLPQELLDEQLFSWHISTLSDTNQGSSSKMWMLRVGSLGQSLPRMTASQQTSLLSWIICPPRQLTPKPTRSGQPKTPSSPASTDLLSLIGQLTSSVFLMAASCGLPTS